MRLRPFLSVDPANRPRLLNPPRLAAAAAAAVLLATAAPAAMAHPACMSGGPGHEMKGGMGMRQAIITVTGTGQATTAPDMAQITVGVTVQAPTAGEAMSQNAARQQAVIDALKSRGIEARDIQTSGLSLSPVQNYPQDGKPPVITGYQAGNMVTIRVRDLPQLGPVLDGLVTAGANEIQGISFQRDDAKAVEAEARKDAVSNARERAEVIAAAAGQKLGRLISLQDSNADAGPPQPMMMRAMADKSGGAPPVEAGELSMSAQVVGTWEMLPLDGEQGSAGDGPDGDEEQGGQHEGQPMGEGAEMGAPAGAAPAGAVPPAEVAPVPPASGAETAPTVPAPPAASN